MAGLDDEKRGTTITIIDGVTSQAVQARQAEKDVSNRIVQAVALVVGRLCQSEDAATVYMGLWDQVDPDSNEVVIDDPYQMCGVLMGADAALKDWYNHLRAIANLGLILIMPKSGGFGRIRMIDPGNAVRQDQKLFAALCDECIEANERTAEVTGAETGYVQAFIDVTPKAKRQRKSKRTAKARSTLKTALPRLESQKV